MILDWHSHIYTPEEAADDLRTWDGKSGPSWGERGCPMVLENFFDAHHKAGIDISVVTNAAHYLRGKSAIGNEPAFRQKRLVDIGIVPIFDSSAHFAEYLKAQRENGRKLVQESNFQRR